ncbi:Ig-like domain-containing protein, partial [Flavobacterium subsaxonicum]
PTVADLQVNEPGVIFYTAATGGTVVSSTTALVDGTIYYASLTVGSCESATRLAITVTVGNAATPTTTDTTQDFCLSDAPTVADLQVNEMGVTFYTTATVGTAIASTTTLVDGTTYYASLTLGTCESATRLAITVTIGNAATPTTTDTTQDFCLADAPTVADIQVNETGVTFYTAATGGTAVPATTALVDDAIYYASVTTAAGCESATRLAITVMVGNAATPTTTDATQDFCLADAPTVADIQVNEAGVIFYTAATGGTAIAPATALVDGATYYASLTIGTCESATRLAITVTVGNAATPTTTDTTQDFCLADAPTVADLQVNETGVTFYNAATGGTAVPATTALVDGSTYYASLTVGTCESATR